jgi:5-methylcytosine-specific restriction endonuclease McrA
VPKAVHKKGKKNKKDRAEFDKKTRLEIVTRYNGLCGHCGRLGVHIHHCYPKGRGGRGVASNGILLCVECHTKIHVEPEMMKFYIDKFRKQFGNEFYMDSIDKGEL